MAADGAMGVDRRHTQLSEDFAAVDLHQMRLASRYTDWIVRQIQPHCGQRILDVGAGIGNISSRLLRHAEYVCALEPNPVCFDHLRHALAGESRFECRPWRIEDCDLDFVASRRIETVVCVNVLEHLEDDMQALIRLKAMLHGATGRLVLVVPAVPAAYGPIDAALGHYRRYSRVGLRSLLSRAGFSITSLRYSNLIGLLAWLYNARLAGRIQQSDAQLRLFNTLIVPWYARLESLLPPPVGLSLFAVAHPARSS